MSTGRRADGLTYLELLITILVAAIGLAIAVPSFEQLRETSRISAELNKLVRAVHVAKIEAAKGGLPAVICPTADSITCASQTTDWQAGWLLFANRDKVHPPQVDAGDTILAVHLFPAGLRVKVNRHVFVFRRFPRRSTNGTVILCSQRRPTLTRALVISYTGRPRTARLRSNGRPYSCQR